MTAKAEEIRLAVRRPVMSGLTAAKGIWRAAWPTFTAELAADRPIWLLAAVYIVLANALAFVLPGDPPVGYFLYVPIWLRGGFAAILIFLLARTLPAILRERPAHPFGRLVARASAYATPRAFAGLALVALQVVLMGTFTSVKNMLPALSGYVWDTRIADIDATLFGGHDPWTLVTPLIARLHILGAVEFLYATGWMLAVALVPAIVALAPSLKPIRVRFFLAYILTWVIIGNLLALTFLSAGPVYFGHVTGDTARFQPLIDLLAANSGSIWSAYDIQRALWDVYEHGMVSFGTGISAFPSEHVAMAALWAITGFQVNRRLGIAGLVFLAFIEAASVALGWHYAIDGLVSMALVVLIWVGIGWTLRRFAPERHEPAPQW